VYTAYASSRASLLVRRHDKHAFLEIEDSKVQSYRVPVTPRLRLALDRLPRQGPYVFPPSPRQRQSLHGVRMRSVGVLER